MIRNHLFAFAGLCLLLGSCDPPAQGGASAKPSGSAAKVASASAAKPTATVATTAAAATGESPAVSGDLETEADFEEEAEKDISTANFETELEAIEKEIAEAN